MAYVLKSSMAGGEQRLLISSWIVLMKQSYNGVYLKTTLQIFVSDALLLCLRPATHSPPRVARESCVVIGVECMII